MTMYMLYQEPSYCRVKLGTPSGGHEETIGQARDGLISLLKIKELHQMLLQEKKLIETTISIRCSQLRREKFLQLMKRVKACLQRVPVMNRLLSLSEDLLKDVNHFVNEEASNYIPCQQSWSYLLYLMSQYHALLTQTAAYSQSSFQYLTCAITTKHLIPVIVIFMGISARVWQLCRTLVNQISDAYNTIYCCHRSILASKSEWVCPNVPCQLSKMVFESLESTINDKTRQINDLTSIEESKIEDHAKSLTSKSLFTITSFGVDEDIGVALNDETLTTKIIRKLETPFTDDTDNYDPKPKKKRKKVLEKCEDWGTNSKVKKKKKRKESFEPLSDESCSLKKKKIYHSCHDKDLKGTVVEKEIKTMNSDASLMKKKSKHNHNAKNCADSNNMSLKLKTTFKPLKKKKNKHRK